MKVKIRWYGSQWCQATEVTWRWEPPFEVFAGRCPSGYFYVEGCDFKKVVTPKVKREVVIHLKQSFQVSERRARLVLNVERSLSGGAHRWQHLYFLCRACIYTKEQIKMVACPRNQIKTHVTQRVMWVFLLTNRQDEIGSGKHRESDLSKINSLL